MVLPVISLPGASLMRALKVVVATVGKRNDMKIRKTRIVICRRRLHEGYRDGHIDRCRA